MGEPWSRFVFAYALIASVFFAGAAFYDGRLDLLLALDAIGFYAWVALRSLPIPFNQRVSCVLMDAVAILGSVILWTGADSIAESPSGLLQPAVGWIILIAIAVCDLGAHVWVRIAKQRWQ